MESEQVEVFENEILMYLKIYCEEHDISDMKRESQSVWNGCLRYIHKYVFNDAKLKVNAIYKTNNISAGVTNYNAYDYELLNDLCDVYITLCFDYDKEISIVGFCNLTGINQDTLFAWKNGEVSSPASTEIYKKLNAYREESLSDKLVTGKQNPVGVLGVLNRCYGWNMPNVSREEVKRSVSANELPLFNKPSVTESLPKLSDTPLPNIVQNEQK